MIDAVLFDLDDTLFDQQDWLIGAWLAVAIAAAPLGVPTADLYRSLRAVASEGSDRGRIIDRALARLGHGHVPVEPLVRAFRSFRTAHLQLFPGVADALTDLRRVVPIGLVTDGDPEIQRAKLRALGLCAAFDAIVISDELGRDHRKPSTVPFLTAARMLDVEPGAVVHVGDRPDKDVAGAIAAGMRAIRVRTGEYDDVGHVVSPWREVPDAATAALLLAMIIRPGRSSRQLVDQ